MKMLKNKKGIAGQVPLIAFVVGLIGVLILIGVNAIVLDAFNDSTTNNSASTVFENGLTFLTNFTGQLGTAGTIAGVLILVILLAAAGIGLFQFGRNRGVF